MWWPLKPNGAPARKEIAEALVITERTADTHAAHIRDKLDLRSRTEIAACAIHHGLA